MRSSYKNKWDSEHPDHQNDDAYHKLHQSVQVEIFRLHTGHSRQKYNLFSNLKIGDSAEYYSRTDKMTATHSLEKCLKYAYERKLFKPIFSPCED